MRINTKLFKEMLLSAFVFAFIAMTTNSDLFSQETTRSPASFDFNEKGITFATADSSSQVIMRFRIQSSLAFNTVSEDDLEIANTDMSIRRMRLRFGGFLYDPRLTFNLQLSFARGDLDFEDTGFPNIIRDAMVFWNFTKNLQVGVGQTKLPGNRQRVISSGDLQFPERSIVNSRFTLDRDFGVQAYYSNNIKDVYFTLRGALSSGDGRYAPRLDGANFAYTGRFELLPFGKFKQGGDYFESDLMREESPKISLGVAYSENIKSTRTRGQLGKKLYEERDMGSLIADAVLKYNGFTFYTEYANRRSDDPITTNSTGDTRYVFVGEGYLGQLSYLFKNNIELASRVSIVAPEMQLKGLKDAEWQRHISSVATYYFHKHRAKMQFELTHNTQEDNLTKQSKKNWLGRFNFEIGI